MRSFLKNWEQVYSVTEFIFLKMKNCPVSNTFEWCAERVSAEIDTLQNVPFEAVSWWYDIFDTYNHLVIENVEDLKEKEPLTYEYLKPQNIQSLITAPLKKGDKIFGFSFREETVDG